MNSAAATSSSQGRLRAVGQVDPRAGRHGRRCSIARSTLTDYHESASASRARTRDAARQARASASPRSCTAPGFTGSGEDHLQSVVGVEATAEGRVRVLAASTEIGQGTNTIFAQIAADALGIAADERSRSRSPTRRTCPTAGRRSRRARAWSWASSSNQRRSVQAARSSMPATSPASYTPTNSSARASATSQRVRRRCARRASTSRRPACAGTTRNTQGDAYGAYAWAVYVAEVTVDIATWETRVDDFVAVQEVGQVIHPVLAAGQIEGGVAQGIGWALYENVVVARRPHGERPDDQLHHADLDGSAAHPRRVRGDSVRVRARAGAKGIGELPMDGPAPAIVNAVAHATGAARRNSR